MWGRNIGRWHDRLRDLFHRLNDYKELKHLKLSRAFPSIWREFLVKAVPGKQWPENVFAGDCCCLRRLPEIAGVWRRLLVIDGECRIDGQSYRNFQFVLKVMSPEIMEIMSDKVYPSPHPVSMKQSGLPVTLCSKQGVDKEKIRYTYVVVCYEIFQINKCLE